MLLKRTIATVLLTAGLVSNQCLHAENIVHLSVLGEDVVVNYVYEGTPESLDNIARSEFILQTESYVPWDVLLLQCGRETPCYLKIKRCQNSKTTYNCTPTN